MDDHHNLVLLDFGCAMPSALSVKARRSAPTATVLFKNIENEVEAMKQVKMKAIQNNIYERIKKALQRKLGHGRFMRGMSAKEEIRIKEMIQTCRQRRHIRQSSDFDRALSARSRAGSARTRNLSAKQVSVEGSCRPKTARPMTTRPMTSRPQTPRESQARARMSQAPSQAITFEVQPTPKAKLKKQNHNRQFSKIPEPQKENSPPSPKSSKMLPAQTQPHPFHGRKMKTKQIANIHNKFNNILDNCENEKQDIVCLGRRIGHFQYFCSKMNQKKGVIEKFCKKIEVMKKDMEDSF